MAVSPGYGHLFGEEGLETATVPSLIIGPTQDDVADYEDDVAFLYTHLGSEDRLLISYIGARHTTPFSSTFSPYTMHFSTAFFGLYLKDETDSAEYVTQEFVEQFEDIAWGIVEDR